MKFSQKTREAVVERAKGNCEICGKAVGDPNIHHRRPRGMGGTKRVSTGSPANALYLHAGCHAWVEVNRSASIDMGYLIRQKQEATEVAFLHHEGWMYLTDDGRYIEAEPIS